MENRRNPLDLSDRTVLVTGASSGIGRETAIVLSGLGARVIVSARRSAELDATLAQMTPGAHAAAPFDLASLADVPEWVRSLAQQYGPLHGLVHAAGLRKTMGLRGVSVDMLQQTFRVNLDSAVMLAKGFRQKGCCGNGASVILLSSVAAFVGGPAMAPYAASKAAVIGLTKSLASELAREGIRVNCIAPGMVESEMTEQLRSAVSGEQFAAIVAQHPLGLGTPWDVACAAAYLLSAAGRWITGQTLVVDGGFSAVRG